MRQLDTRQLEKAEMAAQAGIPLFEGNRSLREVLEARKEELIEVMVAVGEGTEETSFLIEDIVALCSRKVGDAHEGFRIDGRSNTATLIEFRVAAKPEALDGLVDSEQ